MAEYHAIRKIEAQIARAEQKLEDAERKHVNQPSEDTKVDLAFKRRTVEQLRDKELISFRVKICS